jgi:hypothetical protein
MFKRNLKGLYGNTSTVLDFVSEAYAAGFTTIEEAKRIIRDSVIEEKRGLLARIQQRSNRLEVFTKVCNKCGFPKPTSEFAPNVDKRNGLRYFNNLCSICEHERVTHPDHRRKRRETYANSDRAKQLAHQRYLRYKKRQQTQIQQ